MCLFPLWCVPVHFDLPLSNLICPCPIWCVPVYVDIWPIDFTRPMSLSVAAAFSWIDRAQSSTSDFLLLPLQYQSMPSLIWEWIVPKFDLNSFITFAHSTAKSSTFFPKMKKILFLINCSSIHVFRYLAAVGMLFHPSVVLPQQNVGLPLINVQITSRQTEIRLDTF